MVPANSMYVQEVIIMSTRNIRVHRCMYAGELSMNGWAPGRGVNYVGTTPLSSPHVPSEPSSFMASTREDDNKVIIKTKVGQIIHVYSISTYSAYYKHMGDLPYISSEQKGGLIIHTKRIILYRVPIQELQTEAGGFIIHHGLIIRTIRY